MLPLTSLWQVSHGFECGLALDDFSDFQDGDEVECMKIIWKTRLLSLANGASGTIHDPSKDKKKITKKNNR